MNNKKVYVITIIVSLITLVLSCIWQNNVIAVLLGLGCSGLAAAVIALFIERNAADRERKLKEKARYTYFNTLNNLLTTLMEHIIWFDERMVEKDFDWSRPVDDYSSLRYMIWASKEYPNERVVTFDEAKNRLIDIGAKYNLEQQSCMDAKLLQNTQRMFSIIAFSSTNVLNEILRIKSDKLLLHINDYIDMEAIDEIICSISLAIGIMNSRDKNYQLAINCLSNSANTIRNLGGFSNDIRIGLHGHFNLSEL